jgi:hypothetical protein
MRLDPSFLELHRRFAMLEIVRLDAPPLAEREAMFD